MSNSVIDRARSWKFVCQYQDSNLWVILPQQSNQRWKLQQTEDRWVLIVDKVPQLFLEEREAIAFLKKMRAT